MTARWIPVALAISLTLMIGCKGASPTPTRIPPSVRSLPPTATPIPPTVTPVPPTPTTTPLPTLTGSGGGRIVFSSRRGEGDYEVYVMNADGTDKRQLTRDTFESEGPAWSPDSTRIAFTLDTYTGHSDIYVVNADGSDLRRVTTNGGAGADWSPDGTRIAFSLSKPDSDIYVMTVPDGTAADRPDQQRLTKTDRNTTVGSPAWSPGGTQIVCVVHSGAAARGPAGGKSTLYVLNVQDALRSGGASLADLRPLPQVGEVNDKPAWSPTGSQIVFSAVVNNHRDLYVINADGTDLRQLTHTPDLDELDSAWSPDGTQIAFQANPDANWDIYVMDADGSNRRQLTTDVANDTSPDWAP